MAPRTPALAALLTAAAIAAYLLWPHTRTSSHPSPNHVAQPKKPNASSTPAQHAPSNPRLAAPHRAPTLFPTGQAFQALKQRARQGDPKAQRELAQIYDVCYMANFSPETFMEDQAVKARMMQSAEDAERLIRLSQTLADNCREVDGGVMIPLQQMLGWYAQAAENGDLAATAMHYAIGGKNPSSVERQALVEAVIASGDPAAVFMLGNAAPPELMQATGGASDDADKQLTSNAWMIVGCEMGYPCDASSLAMVHFCTHAGYCKGGTFEDMVRSYDGPVSDPERLDAKIEQISRLLNP